MNHDDLERRLRTESGWREVGYVPRDLELGDERSTPRALAPRLRTAGFSAAAVAAAVVLTVAAIGAIGRGADGRGSGATASSPATSAASPSSPATDAATCASGDVVLRPETWGGAAGSRGTSVGISLVNGAAPCELPVAVAARILDGSGSELVSGASDGTGTVTLTPDARFQVAVSWSNWCDPAPQPTLRWDLRFGTGDWIDVVEEQSTSRPSVQPALPVPPCLGEGGSHLSVTQVQPAP